MEEKNDWRGSVLMGSIRAEQRSRGRQQICILIRGLCLPHATCFEPNRGDGVCLAQLGETSEL